MKNNLIILMVLCNVLCTQMKSIQRDFQFEWFHLRFSSGGMEPPGNDSPLDCSRKVSVSPNRCADLCFSRFWEFSN